MNVDEKREERNPDVSDEFHAEEETEHLRDLPTQLMPSAEEVRKTPRLGLHSI